MAPQDRDRGPELVTDIVEELSLVGERLLDPIHHRVEGARQVGDLATSSDRDPFGELRFGDLASGLGEVPDRSDGAAYDQPAGEGHQCDGQNTEGAHESDRLVDLVDLGRQEVGGDEGAGDLTIGGDGNGQPLRGTCVGVEFAELWRRHGRPGGRHIRLLQEVDRSTAARDEWLTVDEEEGTFGNFGHIARFEVGEDRLHVVPVQVTGLRVAPGCEGSQLLGLLSEARRH